MTINENQKTRLNRLINDQLTFTPIRSIVQITDTLFLITHETENRDTMIIKVDKMGKLSSPLCNVVYHREYKPIIK